MSPRERLLEVTSRYADGAMSSDELLELETALRSDRSLRREFVRYMNIDAALARAAGGCEESTLLAPARQTRPHRAFPAKWWGVTAALVLLSVALWRPWTKNTSPTQQPNISVAPSASPVVLTAANNARWADPDADLLLRSGDTPATLLHLESGVAEFRFANGATAALLGPASVRFEGPNQMYLEEGRTLCRCPTPESRITLTTPVTQVADLGTEFAVEAPADKQVARVAVIKGEVRFGTTKPKVLRTGESAQMGRDKVIKLEPLPPELFAELFQVEPSWDSLAATNLLSDTTFAAASCQSPWYRTEGNVDIPAGQSCVIAVHSRSHRFWPGLRQKVETHEIAGSLVLGSVDALMPPDDPLRDRQWAILKIVFIDSEGREFATSYRYFLRSSDKAGQYVTAQVATFAPPGTRSLQIQMLLNARGLLNGTVWFKNPRLAIIPQLEAEQKVR